MSESTIIDGLKTEIDERAENIGQAAKVLLDQGTDLPVDALEVLQTAIQGLGDTVDASGAVLIDKAVEQVKAVTKALALVAKSVTP